MEWSSRINNALRLYQMHEHALHHCSLQELLPFWDVTNLNDHCDEASLLETFKLVEIDGVFAPAVCVYSKWVPFAVMTLAKQPVKVATVVNFPRGDALQQAVGIQLEEGIASGAQEIDVVFPYQAFLAGENEYVSEFVSYCKSLCGKALLKVILETGVIKDPVRIADAAELVALAGADFIKTSTGKVAVGATLEAAAAILVAIQAVKDKCPQALGLKVSGGIRTLQDASMYRMLVVTLMGDAWLTPRHFRIGASKLS